MIIKEKYVVELSYTELALISKFINESKESAFKKIGFTAEDINTLIKMGCELSCYVNSEDR